MDPSETIDQYIGGIADWRGKVLAMIRRAMRAADPAVVEDWKWMGSPVWSCDGMIAVANAHKDKVKCTFHKGAHVADAEHVFNAGLDGKEWRAIDVLENDTLDEAALLRLVKAAIAYNRSRGKGKKALAASPKVDRRGGAATKGAKKRAKKGTAKTAAKTARKAKKRGRGGGP